MSREFEILAENSPDGIARFDLAGRFTYVNATTERILGLDRSEIVGKDNYELGISPALASSASRDLQEAISTRQPVTRVFSYPEGETFFEALLVPELNEQQEVVSVLSLTRNVTGHVLANQRLEDQRHFAEEVIDTVREPMLVLTPDFTIKSTNRSFQNRFFLSEDELIGRPLREVAGGCFHAQGLEDSLRALFRPGRSRLEGFDVEVELPRVGRRVMRLNAHQIDHLQVILLAMEDVTEHLEAISILENERAVQEQQLEDQTRRLRQVLVELSETEDRERQQLADLLHDDLQQILVGIAYRLDLAMSHCESDPMLTQWLVESRERITEVIEKSRDLSHELSPAVFRTQGLPSGLRALAQQLRKEYGLDLEIQLDGDLDEIDATIRNLLYKSIREMLLNVVKHANVEHARVAATRTADRVEVLVADHGRGFDAEKVLRSESGRGLGLFSIRQRLALLDGELIVESRPGRGSRFRLILPIQDNDPAAQILEQEFASRKLDLPAEVEVPAGPVRVLIVDDHAVVRHGIGSLLQIHSSIEILAEAENGWEAIQMVQQHRPDLVLMDYSMPVMNGVEATRKIKQQSPGVHVVALSMYHEPGMEEQMLNAGADAYVQKTSPASRLVETILRVSGRSAS